jgi:hypothetical protein
VGAGFRKRSCSTNRLERDDESERSHHALAQGRCPDFRNVSGIARGGRVYRLMHPGVSPASSRRIPRLGFALSPSAESVNDLGRTPPEKPRHGAGDRARIIMVKFCSNVRREVRGIASTARWPRSFAPFRARTAAKGPAAGRSIMTHGVLHDVIEAGPAHRSDRNRA